MTNHNEVDSDYSTARTYYLDLLEKGKDSIEEMMELAKQSEHPKAFDTLATLYKNQADITGKLLDLHGKRKAYDRKDSGVAPPAELPAPGGTTTNNVFLGTTTDLQKLLAKGEISDDIVDVTPDDI